MQSEFWFNCWKNNTIGFHEAETNPALVKYHDQLKLTPGDTILLPLCGKTLDIPWLISKGYKVVGLELSEVAIKQLFKEMGAQPEISSAHGMKRYSSTGIDIWVGDFFEVKASMLGEVKAVFDRGSLVALPLEMRKQYALHLKSLTPYAPQLLVCYQYDQTLREGPPFSISVEELHDHYAEQYDLQLLDSTDASQQFAADFPLSEKVWLLETTNKL